MLDRHFHLINSQGSPKWSDFLEWLRQIGFRFKFVSLQEWLKMICESKSSKLQNLQKLVEVMIKDEQFFFAQSHFLRSNTDKALKEHFKRSYMKIDERLLRHWIQLLIERKIISPPKPLNGNQLLDKVCIVTGASEGIGEAIAKCLALEGGATVVLAARQREKLANLTLELHSMGNVPETRLMSVTCDVTSQEDVKKLVEKTLERFRRIDILVNCAGCMYYCMIKNGYTEEWRRQIDVNCHGTTNVIGFVVQSEE